LTYFYFNVKYFIKRGRLALTDIKEEMTVCFSDFHIHTNFSFDSKEKIENVCVSAFNSGLSSIAITNHYDHDGIEEGLYSEYLFEKDRENILEAKEKWKDSLSVYYGIEIGQPHTMTEKKIAKIENMGFEFIIGSLHNMKNCFDFYYLDYKKTSPMYDKGIYKKYVKELSEIADCSFIDTIGHITYPERYMKEAGKEFIYEEFEEDFGTLFEKMAKNKIALELNTSGLRQGLFHTMPKVELLEQYKKFGGEYITIGSDSHEAKFVGIGIKETYKKAFEIGDFKVNQIRKKQ